MQLAYKLFDPFLIHLFIYFPSSIHRIFVFGSQQCSERLEINRMAVVSAVQKTESRRTADCLQRFSSVGWLQLH